MGRGGETPRFLQRKSKKYHNQILQALVNKESEKVHKAMTRHILHQLECLRSIVQNREPQGPKEKSLRFVRARFKPIA